MPKAPKPKAPKQSEPTPGAQAPERPRLREAGLVETGMECFRIEVGHTHGVKPGNIVGAIANEAEIEAEYIGRIEIFDEHSTVQLPEGMPKEIFKHLKSVWVSGQRLQISRLAGGGEAAAAPGGGRKPRVGSRDSKRPPGRKPGQRKPG